MANVSIIYFSGSGNTTRLAEAVQAGAQSVPGTTARLIAINGEDIVKGRYNNADVLAQLDASDAIVFGSPTYMGGPAAQFKAFADATGERWFNSAWRNKVAAGFTVSNSPSGDKFSTLQYFHTLAMQHGMIWIGLGELPMQANGINRLGSFGGAMGLSDGDSGGPEPVGGADRSTGEILGRRVAELAAKFNR
jgi:Multimeric flavodoxin WrbA